MTEASQFRLCLIGLPATGKTTYIAALWGYLTSGASPDGYRVTELPNEVHYLNEIARAWIEGKTMPRNSLGATDRIEFTVESPGGSSITILLPDLPGEVFRNAVIRPSIDEDAAEAVTGSDLLLLFVHGEKAKTFSALGDYQVPATEQRDSGVPASPVEQPESDGLSADTSTPVGGQDSMAIEFAIEELDSDTLNTELLHRLVYLTRHTGFPPTAVVVAAWDAHEESGDTPAEWLAREQPMTSQFLEELGHSVATGVIGISAQGANYKDNPSILEKLASERPWACDEGGNRTDIAGPLLWYDRVIEDSDRERPGS